MINCSQENLLCVAVNSMFKKNGLHREKGEIFDENVSIPDELQVLLKIARKVVSPSKDERLYRYAIKWIISWVLYDFVIKERKTKTCEKLLFDAVAIELQYLSPLDKNLPVKDVLENMKQGSITSPYLDKPDLVAIVKDEAQRYFILKGEQESVEKDRFNNQRPRRLKACVRAIQYATMFHRERNDYLQELTKKLTVEMKKKGVSVTENISPITSSTEQLSSVEKTKAPVDGTAKFGGIASPIRQGTASTENPEEQEEAAGDKDEYYAKLRNLDDVTQKSIMAFGAWVNNEHIEASVFEPIFGLEEAHALFKSIHHTRWTNDDTIGVLKQLKDSSLIVENEENDTYRLHPIILEDAKRRWQENADIESKKAASKWYMNTTLDFDVSWKRSIFPMLFLIGLIAIVEVSHFYGGKINIPILVNLTFLSTILSCYSYWRKMTIPELWNALRTIINLWITDVDESKIFRKTSSSIDIRLNVKRLGYLQQIQSFSREINVLGVLMVVMILAAISSLFASPVLFGVVVPFAILLSYGTINILAYAMARQVQLYRTLVLTP